jgi:hypothetical protein
MSATDINTIAWKNDNTVAHAFKLKFSTTLKHLRGKIGGADHVDYLRFKVGQRSSIKLLLSRQQHPIKMQLLDRKQQLIQSIDHRKKTTLQAVLNPGTYFIRLKTFDRSIKRYRLGFSANPDHSSLLFANSSLVEDFTAVSSPLSPLQSLSQPQSQYYTFKYSYGNGDYYTGYGYSQAETYKDGQDLFDPIVNETGFKGGYKITSVQNSINTKPINQVFVDYYYDSERMSDYKPSGFGNSGLGSESGYLFSQDGVEGAKLR